MSGDVRGNGSGGFFAWFVHSQVSGSVVLLLCTIVALVWANSPWAESYAELSHTKIGISWGDAKFALSFQHWINDALMAVFFFVVGLEIKRELVVGRLSSARLAILPVTAAIGGMVVPALLYAAFNSGGAGARGWGVPMATDIAFALGVLALLGSRVPISLKIFVTALAIADDLGAVLVIALFYTDEIRFGALLVAGVCLFLIFCAARAGVRRPGVYILLALGVWIDVLASGVHATVAGILVALLVPVRARLDPRHFIEVASERVGQLRDAKLTQESMIFDRAQLDAIAELHEVTGDMHPAGLRLEEYLHPIQAFLILPLFALFNAGVAIDGRILEILANPVSLGIVAGLTLGKPLGIALFSWLAVKSGYAELPEGVTWPQLGAAGALAGIGFTMSLFVSDLAFVDATLIAEAKVGILVASVLSGIVGFLALRASLSRA